MKRLLPWPGEPDSLGGEAPVQASGAEADSNAPAAGKSPRLNATRTGAAKTKEQDRTIGGIGPGQPGHPDIVMNSLGILKHGSLTDAWELAAEKPGEKRRVWNRDGRMPAPRRRKAGPRGIFRIGFLAVRIAEYFLFFETARRLRRSTADIFVLRGSSPSPPIFCSDSFF